MCRPLVALPYSCFRINLFFQSSSPLFFNSASLGGRHNNGGSSTACLEPQEPLFQDSPKDGLVGGKEKLKANLSDKRCSIILVREWLTLLSSLGLGAREDRKGTIPSKMSSSDPFWPLGEITPEDAHCSSLQKMLLKRA